MKSFELSYKIEEGRSWRSKGSIDIKSNLADDELIDCGLAKSLIESLKTESAVLEPDKLILTIAEAQKREIETSLENMDDMAVHAKVHADKAHQVLLDVAEDAEEKYLEIEKKYSDIEKRFTGKIKATTETISGEMLKLAVVEEKLNRINNYSLDKLSEALKGLIKIIETDPELVKLVLNHKNKTV